MAISAAVHNELVDLAFQDGHHVKMLFYPLAWAKAPTMACSWVGNEFPPIPRAKIPKQPGVYVFLVKTDIFDFPHASGLFYIGKAKNLYERIGAYINDVDKKRLSATRPLVWRMLNQWDGHLQYFYTVTPDVTAAEVLENQMLSAFIPPFNKQFEATTSATVRAFL
jgi:hypothetical protein